VLTPEAVEVVREAFWIAIIWVVSHESHFVHIRPKTIAVRLAKLVIQEVRDGAQDPEKVTVSVLRVLRAERLSDPQADTREATISFRDDNSSNWHLSGISQSLLRERFADLVEAPHNLARNPHSMNRAMPVPCSSDTRHPAGKISATRSIIARQKPCNRSAKKRMQRACSHSKQDARSQL
jgi:hypothetical protein